MKLSVVIVSYNVKYYLEQCLLSLQKAAAGIAVEVYVVDNHSKDGSAEYLSQRFPDIHIIACNHNLGFARANNLALRQCVGEYVLLLNPDTVLGEEVLRDTLHFMDEHEDAGGLGVRMLTTTGESAKESRRGLPSPMVAFYKMSGLCTRFPHHARLGHYYMGNLPWNRPGQIEVMSGAFSLMRRKAVNQVGYLDEDYFMYGEDIDLSYRLLKAGFHNYYYPARMLHYKGESTEKSSFRYVHVFYEAMLIFLRKHYSGMSRLLVGPIQVGIYMKAFVALLKMQAGKMRKNLGFVAPDEDAFSQYVFIGSESMLEACRTISSKRGLDAIYIIGGKDTLPDGHLTETVLRQMEQGSKRRDGKAEEVIHYIVYDVTVYRYDEIFEIFARHPQPHFRLGFYQPSMNKIITEKEIL